MYSSSPSSETEQAKLSSLSQCWSSEPLCTVVWQLLAVPTVQVNYLFFSNRQKAGFLGSTQAALHAVHACTRTHRPGTSTKDSPLDSSEEAEQVFLFCGKRGALCSSVKKSHFHELPIRCRASRAGFHAGTGHLNRVISSPCSFTYVPYSSGKLPKHYCPEINECTLYSCITSISYLLLGLHKGEGLTFLFMETEQCKHWLICPKLQVNQWQRQNQVP